MSRTFAIVCLLFALAVPAPSSADAEALREFDNPEQRERYQELLEELRCLVCQNESLASSSADLAQDLRDEVYRLVVVENRSRAAAIDFLTERYGDFVLYRPPVRPYTWLLWFGPALMLLAGIGVVVIVVRQRRRADAVPLSDAERARAEQLLKGDDESS